MILLATIFIIFAQITETDLSEASHVHISLVLSYMDMYQLVRVRT